MPIATQSIHIHPVYLPIYIDITPLKYLPQILGKAIVAERWTISRQRDVTRCWSRCRCIVNHLKDASTEQGWWELKGGKSLQCHLGHPTKKLKLFTIIVP